MSPGGISPTVRFLKEPPAGLYRSIVSNTGRSGDVSALLSAWGHGDIHARDRLMAVVYDELRRLASAYLRRERQSHTLQPTALVNEAYMRLAAQDRTNWKNRAQFFGIAAQMMRRILVDHARSHRAAKRPEAGGRVVLDDSIATVEPRECELLELDQALSELEALDPRLARIVELRYFGGLSEQEVARVLGVSRSTITRDWHTAKAWLFRRVSAHKIRP
jgi:RNA polymerase sigma-70 factor (ECF subfamily)